MEYLPAELLVNIFERLNVADASKCKLINRRFNEILEKNWKKIQKEKITLSVSAGMLNEYRVGISGDTVLSLRRKRIEVSHPTRKNELATIFAKKLGAPLPISNTISFSITNMAIAKIICMVQHKFCIATLKLSFSNRNAIDGLVSVLPENSVKHLTYSCPKTSEEVIKVLRKLGKDRIRSLSIENSCGPKISDPTVMDSLMPNIIYKNIYAPFYMVSIKTVLKVIQTWINSKWQNVWCLLRTTEHIREEIHKRYIAIPENERVRNRYRLARKSDNRRLYVTFEEALRYNRQMVVRIFDDRKYVQKFLQLPEGSYA